MAVEIISIGLVVNDRQLQYAFTIPPTMLARADEAIDRFNFGQRLLHLLRAFAGTQLPS